MKSTPILLLLAFFPLLLAAQVDNKPIREKLEKPIYVVLDEDFGEEYNTAIRETMASWWKLSAYQFIEASELPDLKEDVNHVFLMLTENEGIDGDIRAYKSVITLANFARSGRYKNNITGAAIDLESSSATRLSIINALRVIQDKTRFEMAKQDGEADEYEDWLKPRTQRLKDLTLYLSRGDIEVESSELPKLYSGKFDLISSKELAAMMEAPQKGSAYAYVRGFKISGGYVIVKTIVDSESGELLYFSTSGGSGTDGKLGKKDWKSLE